MSKLNGSIIVCKRESKTVLRKDSLYRNSEEIDFLQDFRIFNKTAFKSSSETALSLYLIYFKYHYHDPLPQSPKLQLYSVVATVIITAGQV